MRRTVENKEILDVLRRRYTLQQRQGIRPHGKYPREVMQVVRTLNEENASQPREKRREPFTPDTLPFRAVGKSLDSLPLSRREFERYQELSKLERKNEQAWAAMKDPSIALLVCNKRYIDDLLVRAVLVKTEDGKCVATDSFLKRLTPANLLECEKEFWEATNTDKYMKDLMFSECNEKGQRISRVFGPTPGHRVGMSYPLQASLLSYWGLADRNEAATISISLNIRLRKEYFARMHEAIAKEVKSRRLANLNHNANASYRDLIESRRKELERQYRRLAEPTIKDEGLRIEVIFTIVGLQPHLEPGLPTKRRLN